MGNGPADTNVFTGKGRKEVVQVPKHRFPHSPWRRPWWSREKHEKEWQKISVVD